MLAAGMETTITRLDFKVLIYRDRVGYIAQCLNYDLVTEGETVLDVLNSFVQVIKTHISLCLRNGNEPFADFEPAPDKFWKMYDASVTEQTAFSFQYEGRYDACGSMKLAD